MEVSFIRCFHHLLSCPSLQDVSKRLSLPMDIRLPPEFLQKLQMESPEFPKPLSRMSRRASLVSLHVQSKQCWHSTLLCACSTHPVHVPLCKLPCTDTHTHRKSLSAHSQQYVPMSPMHICPCAYARTHPFLVPPLHVQIHALLCRSPGPCIPSPSSAHTWRPSRGRRWKPPAAPRTLEPLRVEMQMLINNGLAFALMLAFQFFYCRASAYLGTKTWCPVGKRASTCPVARCWQVSSDLVCLSWGGRREWQGLLFKLQELRSALGFGPVVLGAIPCLGT